MNIYEAPILEPHEEDIVSRQLESRFEGTVATFNVTHHPGTGHLVIGAKVLRGMRENSVENVQMIVDGNDTSNPFDQYTTALLGRVANYNDTHQ